MLRHVCSSVLLLLLLLLLLAPSPTPAKLDAAKSPPMGWRSW
jgi:hypothetical protein